MRREKEAIKSQLCACACSGACACSVDRWRRFLDRVPQTDVRHARSTFSQHLKHEVHIERIAKSTVLVHVVLRAPHALRERFDLACLTSVCDAEQLYTDAALVLDASTHVAAVSGSGAIIIDLHSMHKHSRLFPFLRAPHALRER